MTPQEMKALRALVKSWRDEAAAHPFTSAGRSGCADDLDTFLSSLTAAGEGAATVDARMFPIMGRAVATRVAPIPWSVIAPHEQQAQWNHSQSLARLAERGGLSPCEAVAVLEDRPWKAMDFDVAERKLREIVASSEQPSPADGKAPACMEPTPDRSGRSCDKPRGHDGAHWTYGGSTLTWPAADGKAQEPEIGICDCGDTGKRDCPRCWSLWPGQEPPRKLKPTPSPVEEGQSVHQEEKASEKS